MAASSHRLAAALASGLGQVVPAGYRLKADGATVLVYRTATFVGSSPAADILDEDDERTLAEKTHSAVYAVLGKVQDIISEDLRLPWPSVDGRQMALPFAKIEAGRISLFYGEGERPTVTLPSISLAELSKP